MFALLIRIFFFVFKLVRKRLISCLKSQNKPREYIAELNEYLLSFQADHEAWLELSDAYLGEMEFAKAAFCLEELLLMNPHNHCYHQRFGDIKYTQGQYEVAKSYYAYSLKLNPNNVRALYGLMLVTANLKSSGKLGQKEAVENARLNAWAKEQLELKYKVCLFLLIFSTTLEFNRFYYEKQNKGKK